MPKYAQLIQRSFKFQKIRWIPILKRNCNYKFDREQTIHRFYTNNVGRSWSCLEKTSHLPGDSTTMIPITRNEQREKGSSLLMKPLTGSLGAEISGIHLGKLVKECDLNGMKDLDLEKGHNYGKEKIFTDKERITHNEIQNIQKAFLDYSVLVFRNQSNLSKEDLLAICRIFGVPEDRPVVKAQYGLEMIHDLIREEGTPGKYGEVWHHDCSYAKAPPLGALLYALEVPPYGNDTNFASMYLAYESLSDSMKNLIDPLKAIHTAFKNTEIVKRDPNGEYLDYNEVIHPVVRTHPITGKKCLFVNPFFATRFEGMTIDESRGLMEYLCSIINRSEFQCRVNWEPETLTVWDNRCSVHMAIRDMNEGRRVMRRLEIKGDVPY